MAGAAKTGFKGQIDRGKLQSSLLEFGRNFGDNSAQCLVRWAVQTCREMAFETQAWGGNSRVKQRRAITVDGWNVCLVVKKLKRRGSTYEAEGINGKYSVPAHRVLNSPEEVDAWIELNRTSGRKRTKKISNQDKKVCTETIFKKGIQARLAKAGMAKGAWLGAGHKIAIGQKGAQKAAISKGYMSYAQKHARFGTAKKPISGWKSSASITSTLDYSGSKDVLSNGASRKAIDFGLKKAVKWYRMANKPKKA